MQCPLCRDSVLEPKFIRGVEVDICPRCRGLWLDRGEIDKLADDAMPPPPPAARIDDRRDHRDGDRREPRERDRREYRDDDRRYRDDDRRYRDDDRPKSKKKSTAKRLADLLEDILD